MSGIDPGIRTYVQISKRGTALPKHPYRAAWEARLAAAAVAGIPQCASHVSSGVLVNQQVSLHQELLVSDQTCFERIPQRNVQ